MKFVWAIFVFAIAACLIALVWWLVSLNLQAQTWTTIVLGIIAAAIAAWGVLTQRMIARRRATFDHIVKSNLDKDMIDAMRIVIRLASGSGGLAEWAALDKRDSVEAQAIRTVLNEMEYISIGIQAGIIDFDFYKKWSKSGVLRKWQWAKPYVEKIRTNTNNNNLFHEFEQLAKWMDDTPPPRRSRNAGKWW